MGLCSGKPSTHPPYVLHTVSTPPPPEPTFEAGAGEAKGEVQDGPNLPKVPAMDRRVNEIVGSEEARDKAKQGWRTLKNQQSLSASQSPKARRRGPSGQGGGSGVGGTPSQSPARRVLRRESHRDSPGLRGPPSARRGKPCKGALPTMPGRSSSRFGFEDLDNKSILGVGGTAYVRLATLKSDPSTALAVKIMHKREMVKRRMVRYVRREADILTLLANANAGRSSDGQSRAAESPRTASRRRLSGDHAQGGGDAAPCPFFVSLKARVQDSSRVGFVLDFVHGGDLYGRLRRVVRFPEDVAKFYAAELVEAIAFMHEQRVAYRDLKPENVLIDAHGHVRVTDFGFAKVLDSKGRCLTRVGTPHYLAPEQLDKRNKEGYTEIVDWWALGCLIYEMLVGKPCFGSSVDSSYEVFTRIMSGKPPRFPFGTNKHARDLVTDMLRIAREKRVKSAGQLRAHPWFHGLDWGAVRSLRLAPPFVPALSGPTDCRHFDAYDESDTDYVTGKRTREKWSSKKKGKSGGSDSGIAADGDGGEATNEILVGGKDPFAFF